MKKPRSIRYPGPHKLAVHASTRSRHEDTDRGTLWTDAELSWLMANFQSRPVDECARHLRRSEQAVIQQYDRCHEALIEELAEANANPGKLWEPWEDDWLKQNLELLGHIVCAQRLKRSPHSVRARAESLGLKPAKAA